MPTVPDPFRFVLARDRMQHSFEQSAEGPRVTGRKVIRPKKALGHGMIDLLEEDAVQV
jgi:hypothetical protein